MRKSKKYDYEEVFSRYTENPNLETANIFHLYDTKKQCAVKGDGYRDSRIFNCVAYNTETMEKVNLGEHDGIDLLSVDVLSVRIFADGSTMIKLLKEYRFSNTYSIVVLNRQ
jgi:hypothetical protein